MNKFLQLLTISCLVVSIQGLKLPEKWNKCKVPVSLDWKRNKCVENAISVALKDLTSDIGKDLGFASLEPFRINKMTIGQNAQTSSVKLILKFRNLDIFGLRNLQIKSARGKLSSPKNWTVEIEGYMPMMAMKSDYTIDGNVLILPITGTGKCNITYDKVRAVANLYGQSEIKDGKEYLKLIDQKLSLDIHGLTVYLDNLFNGNKLLGEDMNKVLNENWEVLYQELRPSMERGIMKNIAKYAKKLLETTEYNQLFVE